MSFVGWPDDFEESKKPGIERHLRETARRIVKHWGKVSNDRILSLRKRALITGSGSGIGRKIALDFARAGADVILHDIGLTEAVSEVGEEIAHMGRAVDIVTGDLALPQTGAKIAGEARRLGGEIDILVLNASEQVRRLLVEIPASEAERQMQVNFHAPMEIIQNLIEPMKRRKWGRVLAIGSVQQVKPHPEMAVYAASKAALANLILNLALQVAPHGVTANTLAPGVIVTPRNSSALSDPAYAEKMRQTIPAGVFGSVDDCAQAALMLCSEAGRYITGQTLHVDGGMHI